MAYARVVTDDATFGWLCDVHARVGSVPVPDPEMLMTLGEPDGRL